MAVVLAELDRRLREGSAIERHISVVGPEFTGRPMTLIVEATLQRDRPDFPDSLRRRMAEASETAQCHYVTGSADLVLMPALADMEENGSSTRRHFADPHVKRFDTMVMMTRIKFEPAMKLAEPVGNSLALGDDPPRRLSGSFAEPLRQFYLHGRECSSTLYGGDTAAMPNPRQGFPIATAGIPCGLLRCSAPSSNRSRPGNGIPWMTSSSSCRISGRKAAWSGTWGSCRSRRD